MRDMVSIWALEVGNDYLFIYHSLSRVRQIDSPGRTGLDTYLECFFTLIIKHAWSSDRRGRDTG